ncbi:MAG: AraC family transcriptional regulator [Bacillota bacterium]
MLIKDNLFHEKKDSDFYLLKTKRPYPESTYHFHETFEIWYLKNKNAKAFIKDKPYNLTPGDILIINKNTIHKLQVEKKNVNPSRIVLEFKNNFIHDYSKTSHNLLECFKMKNYFIRLDFSQKKFIDNIFSTMLKEKKNQKFNHELYLKTLLIDLLIILNRIMRKSSFSNFNPSNSTHEMISQVSRYINNNHKKDLTLKSLADKFSFSRYYLCRKFKEVTGFSFSEYLNNIRIKEAQKLLKNSETNVTVIAGKVGYNSISQFYRMFKKISNTTPLDFRKQYKK